MEFSTFFPTYSGTHQNRTAHCTVVPEVNLSHSGTLYFHTRLAINSDFDLRAFLGRGESIDPRAAQTSVHGKQEQNLEVLFDKIFEICVNYSNYYADGFIFCILDVF